MSHLKDVDGNTVYCSTCTLPISKVFKVTYKYDSLAVCSKHCLSDMLGLLWQDGFLWAKVYPPYTVNKDTPAWGLEKTT